MGNASGDVHIQAADVTLRCDFEALDLIETRHGPIFTLLSNTSSAKAATMVDVFAILASIDVSAAWGVMRKIGYGEMVARMVECVTATFSPEGGQGNAKARQPKGTTGRAR